MFRKVLSVNLLQNQIAVRGIRRERFDNSVVVSLQQKLCVDQGTQFTNVLILWVVLLVEFDYDLHC